MFSLKNEPQDVMSLLVDGHKLYASTFWQSLPYAIVATLCMAMPRILLTFPLFSYPDPTFSTTSVVLLFYGIGLWIVSACVIRLNSLCYHIPSRFSQSLRQAALKWLPLILLFIIYSIVILASTMLLVIPALFLLVAFSLGFILLLSHNQSFTQALWMSARLVQGHWWHTFGVVFVPLLCFSTALMALFYLEIRLLSSHPSPVVALAFQIPSLILAIGFIPFSISVALVLLHDLRSRIHAKRPPWS